MYANIGESTVPTPKTELDLDDQKPTESAAEHSNVADASHYASQHRLPDGES